MVYMTFMCTKCRLTTIDFQKRDGQWRDMFAGLGDPWTMNAQKIPLIGKTCKATTLALGSASDARDPYPS